MSIRLRHLLLALLSGALAAGLCSARADETDMVKEKLFQAKKEYDAEVQKFKKAIADQLDKREDDARKAGNKKHVDLIKLERDAFEKTGELPQMVSSTIREPLRTARTKLNASYTAAVKELVRLKMDDAAGATEKEQQEFQVSAALLIGKRIFVSTLKPFNIKVEDNNFEKDASKFKMDGEAIPHSIFMHAQHEGGEASVSYTLPAKIVAFRASIGIPKHADTQENPASPITFEVLGDGKSLWKSEPVASVDTFQKCSVNLDKVKTLTLHVSCRDGRWGHAVWFGPIVIE
jgi:hypothetical protein